MERYLAAIAITVLLCSLAACGKTATPASDSSTKPAQSSQAASETIAPETPVSSPAPVKTVVSVDYAPDGLAAAYTDGVGANATQKQWHRLKLQRQRVVRLG